MPPWAGASIGPAPSGSPWQLKQEVTPVRVLLSLVLSAAASAEYPLFFGIWMLKFGNEGNFTAEKSLSPTT